MPIINIDGWKGLTQSQKKLWVKELTKATVDILKIPYDEVIIYINDIDKSSWGQAATMGTDPDWLINSRKKQI
jgi:4-oxalocrotonate tautomerase family enzyme